MDLADSANVVNAVFIQIHLISIWRLMLKLVYSDIPTLPLSRGSMLK